MHRALPLHPSLEQLKKQAKDLRKGHQSASAEAAERIKESLPRLSDATVEEILQGHFSLQEAADRGADSRPLFARGLAAAGRRHRTGAVARFAGDASYPRNPAAAADAVHDGH